MTRPLRPLAIVVLVALAAGAAVAQPTPAPDDTPVPEATVPATPPAPASEVRWTEFELTGRLVDNPERLRRIFAAELQNKPVLTAQARNDLAAFATEIGYQLVDTAQGPLPGGGVKITLSLDPIVVVRWVDIRLKLPVLESLFGGLSDDELRRRLRLRVGTSLPWHADDRQALLNEDAERIRRFLRDEGYFDASVEITARPTKRNGARIVVVATFGRPYARGRIEVVNASSGGADLAIPAAEVARSFSKGRCSLFGKRCRFSYTRLLADLDEVTAMFQRRGYPSVRVIHDFDPLTSFDRRTHKVDIRVSIDPRRKLDVVFEGNDKSSFPDEVLARELTFAAAGTADDVEIAASARLLERYFQVRGYFDVAVTSERVRLGSFDRVVYRIEPGQRRKVRDVRVLCRRFGEPETDTCSLPHAELEDVLGTHVTVNPIIGAPVYASTAQIEADRDALVRYYRDRGFEHARAHADLAPTPAGWAAVAVSAAQVLAEEQPNQLHVRFVVEEGPRTVIEQMHVVFEGRAAGGANAGDERRILERVGIKPGEPYVRAKLDAAARDITDWYWSFGRPRARVTVLEPLPGITPHGVIVTFNIEERQELRIGEVLVRGNFRTRGWVIRDELDFATGERLTGSLVTAGPRRLRSTNLFDAVKLDFVGMEDSRRDTVNVIVRVEERHDVRGRLDVELGGSLENGLFSRLKPSLPNISGTGVRADGSITVGVTPRDWNDFNLEYFGLEQTTRLPHWLARRYVKASFDSELGVYYRIQDTERFGDLITAGVTVAGSRSWERPRSDDDGARLVTASLRYDWRLRSRDEELVRPPGLAGNLSTNPISTRTGTIGVHLSWDQRRDARGNLNPLAPDAGFRLEGGAAYASPDLFGQDTFVKLNGLGQVFLTRGRLQLRLDARYDHGIPLGGAVLLPEVERFFAGGDSTVRGFEEDRLATEIIEQPVPPLGQTTQQKILPAGGNIRALSTVDAQVTVWRLWGFPVASALFVDAGLITNIWKTVDADDIRPAAGSAVRMLLPIGAVALEYAVPLAPKTGDNPRGRIHFAVALRY